MSNREKTALGDALRQDYLLPELLDHLGLARSSYFYQRSRTHQFSKKSCEVIVELAAQHERDFRLRKAA